jgi:hypothetical protein
MEGGEVLMRCCISGALGRASGSAYSWWPTGTSGKNDVPSAGNEA